MKTGPKRTSLSVRLERNSMPEPNTGCRLWCGAVGKNGYGNTTLGGRNSVVAAHRAAWIDAHGAIPEGMFVCHRCDVKLCVNVDHLYVGTPKQNSEDSVMRGLHPRGTRFGHAVFTDDLVRLVRSYKSNGWKSTQIGKAVNRDPSHIRRVLRGEIWGHVV